MFIDIVGLPQGTKYLRLQAYGLINEDNLSDAEVLKALNSETFNWQIHAASRKLVIKLLTGALLVELALIPIYWVSLTVDFILLALHTLFRKIDQFLPIFSFFIAIWQMSRFILIDLINSLTSPVNSIFVPLWEELTNPATRGSAFLKLVMGLIISGLFITLGLFALGTPIPSFLLFIKPFILAISPGISAVFSWVAGWIGPSGAGFLMIAGATLVGLKIPLRFSLWVIGFKGKLSRFWESSHWKSPIDDSQPKDDSQAKEFKSIHPVCKKEKLIVPVKPNLSLVTLPKYLRESKDFKENVETKIGDDFFVDRNDVTNTYCRLLSNTPIGSIIESSEENLPFCNPIFSFKKLLGWNPPANIYIPDDKTPKVSKTPSKQLSWQDTWNTFASSHPAASDIFFDDLLEFLVIKKRLDDQCKLLSHGSDRSLVWAISDFDKAFGMTYQEFFASESILTAWENFIKQNGLQKEWKARVKERTQDPSEQSSSWSFRRQTQARPSGASRPSHAQSSSAEIKHRYQVDAKRQSQTSGKSTPKDIKAHPQSTPLVTKPQLISIRN